MTKNCKQALNAILKITNHSSSRFAVNDIYKEFHLYPGNEPAEKYSDYENEIDAIMAFLVDAGYVQFISGHVYRLTLKGLHRYWFLMERALLQIVLPALISILSAIATLWANGYLPAPR